MLVIPHNNNLVLVITDYTPQQHPGTGYPPQQQDPGTGYPPQQQQYPGYSPSYPGTEILLAFANSSNDNNKQPTFNPNA